MSLPAKLRSLTISGIVSFDLRYLLLLIVVAIVGLAVAGIRWRYVSAVVYFVDVFALMNVVLIYVFAPQYGVRLFHHKTALLGSGPYALTLKQLVYESIVLMKYVFSLPLALIFLLTTNPTEFAAGLNKIGVSYRIAYAVALTLRYIPDVQQESVTISRAQQARGYDMSKKAPLVQRVRGAAGILMPLLFHHWDELMISADRWTCVVLVKRNVVVGTTSRLSVVMIGLCWWEWSYLYCLR